MFNRFDKKEIYYLQSRICRYLKATRMSDLDKYKEKINKVEDSGLESTSRTLAILNEVGEVDSIIAM